MDWSAGQRGGSEKCLKSGDLVFECCDVSSRSKPWIDRALRYFGKLKLRCGRSRSRSRGFSGGQSLEYGEVFQK